MCRGLPALALVLTTCVYVSLGRAQDATSSNAVLSPSEQAIFRSAVELVALNVTVLDQHKRFVTGLGPEDFAVFENGMPQELTFFGLADVPIDLSLMVDLSASMSPQIETVRKAATGLIRKLRPGDRAMIVGFSGRGRTPYGCHPLYHRAEERITE